VTVDLSDFQAEYEGSIPFTRSSHSPRERVVVGDLVEPCEVSFVGFRI